MKEIICANCKTNLGAGYKYCYCSRCYRSLNTDVDYLTQGMPCGDELDYGAEPHFGGYEISNGVLFSYTGASAVIPEGVTAITDGAFDAGGFCDELGYSLLKSVRLPASLKCMDYGALMQMGLKIIDVDPKNPRFASIDGNLYSRDGTIFLRYAAGNAAWSFEVPQSVKQVGNYAFAFCENLDEISLPDSIKTIGKFAFKGCVSLKKINVPGGVTAIGESAFEHCDCLKSIDLPEGLEVIDCNAFKYCGALEEITMPKSLISVGSCAFESCSALRNVNLNEGLKNIDYKAFCYCRSLQTIVIPKSVERMVRWTFDFCETLKIIYCAADKKPAGWDREWKSNGTCQARLVWGYTGGNSPKRQKKEEITASDLVRTLQKKAEDGDANAQFALAEKYFHGFGVKRSYKAAFGWYKKAAEGGHVPALTCVGYCYLFSLGVQGDCAAAVKIFFEAKKKGDVRAAFLIAFCDYYALSTGYYISEKKRYSRLAAASEFFEAARSGYAPALCWAAHFYDYDNKMPNAEQLAETAYEKAAKNGSKVAILWHYENDTKFSHTEEGGRLIDNIFPYVPHNLNELKKRAESGDVGLQVCLADRYNGGIGVKTDYAQAFKWYRRAADAGDFMAMYKLAKLYAKGRAYDKDGYPDLRNHSGMARKWMLRSAEQGYWKAISDLYTDPDVLMETEEIIKGFFEDVKNLPEREKRDFWASLGNGYVPKSSEDDDIED